MRTRTDLQGPQISGNELGQTADFERHLHKNLQF